MLRIEAYLEKLAKEEGPRLFNTKNVGAALVGGTTKFLLRDVIEGTRYGHKIPGINFVYDPRLRSHRYLRYTSGILPALVTGGLAYKLLGGLEKKAGLFDNCTPLEILRLKLGVQRYLEKRAAEARFEKIAGMARWKILRNALRYNLSGTNTVGMSDKEKAFRFAYHRFQQNLNTAKNTGQLNQFYQARIDKGLKTRNIVQTDASVIPVKGGIKAGIGGVIRQNGVETDRFSLPAKATTVQNAENAAFREGVNRLPQKVSGGRVALVDARGTANDPQNKWLAHQNNMGVEWIPRSLNTDADALAGKASRLAPIVKKKGNP